MTDGVKRPDWRRRERACCGGVPRRLAVYASRRGSFPSAHRLRPPARSTVARAAFLDAPEFPRDFITYAMIVVICTPLRCSLVGQAGGLARGLDD